MRAVVLSDLLQAKAADAYVLTFGLFPSSNPSTIISCRIELRSGQISVVEVRGVGMPPRRPYRWPVRRAEDIAVLRALQALVRGDLPGVEVNSFLPPPAPYASINWSTKFNGVSVFMLYLQSGTTLPDVMVRLIDAVMSGGGCQAKAQLERVALNRFHILQL